MTAISSNIWTKDNSKNKPAKEDMRNQKAGAGKPFLKE